MKTFLYVVALWIMPKIFTCTVDAADITGEQAINEYLKSDKIPRLSTNAEKATAGRRFDFDMQVIFSNEKIKELNLASSVLRVVAQEDRAACLISSLDATPFAYMTSELCIGFFDPKQPGVLLYLNRGSFNLVLGGTQNENEFGMSCEYDVKFASGEVTLNIARAFSPSFLSSREVFFYAPGHEIAIMGKQGSQLSLFMSEEKDSNAFGFSKVVLQSIGVRVSINPIRVSQAPRISILGRKLRDFERLGVTIKPLPPGVLVGSFVRADFPANDSEKRAARVFRKAFFTDGG